MDLKGIMLSEGSQSQKVTYCVIPFITHIYVIPENAKLKQQKKDQCVPGVRWEGGTDSMEEM